MKNNNEEVAIQMRLFVDSLISITKKTVTPRQIEMFLMTNDLVLKDARKNSHKTIQNQINEDIKICNSKYEYRNIMTMEGQKKNLHRCESYYEYLRRNFACRASSSQKKKNEFNLHMNFLIAEHYIAKIVEEECELF